MLLKQKILLIVFSLSAINASAQQFGGNPPSLKWNQINTDTARIIFPVGLEEQAKDVARLIHDLARTTQYSIGDRLRKINIVLQNQTTISNGYVALGPYRSEFFLTPTQNSFELGSLPWHKTLALHEYRHVQQNNNFRNGLTRVFYYVFGQEGQALASNLSIPDWFWEGDAVYQETLMSNQGRGRIPYFFNDYRSIWAAGKNYSWMKLRNGSYRDMTPDHYRLGYMLVAYGREKYGDSIWAKVTREASGFRGLFYPFQHAVKSATGESFLKFRNEALDYFRLQQKQDGKDAGADYAKQHRHFDGDEEFPQWLGTDDIIYVKSSYKKIPAFYTKNIHTGKEKRISIKAVSDDNYFSYKNGKLVYAAYKSDARWGWKNFGVITILDLKTGRERIVTKKTKYFSPDISEDGKRVVAVEMAANGKNTIQLIDAGSGEIISSVPNPEQYVFTYPKFYDAGHIISAVRNKSGEMALGMINLNSGEAQWLTPFTMNAIAVPQVNKDTISFTMSEEGQERLFASIRGDLFRFIAPFANASTGSYQLATNNGQAAYNMFTAAGYHLFTGAAVFEKTDSFALQSSNIRDIPGRSKEKINLISDTSAVNYRISKYPAAYRLINVHSWRPYFSDPEYSYSLISENILNTLQSELYFTYNRNEKYKQTGASLAYAGFFPIISGGASYIFDRSALNDANQEVTSNEFNTNFGLSVPLAFTNGSFNQSVTLSGSFNARQIYYTGASKNIYPDRKFNYGEFILSAVNQQIAARQQIYPRFAQTFYARYRNLFGTNATRQLLLSGALYLPGLFTNHSLVLQAAYQARDTTNAGLFSNGFPASRGYAAIDFPRMWKLGANYHFPIAYPDWGFGNIVFFQRIRGNIYFDYTKLKSLRTGLTIPYRSAGGELYFDTKWWNQLPVSFGVRYSRLFDTDLTGRGPGQWELVLPLNLLSR